MKFIISAAPFRLCKKITVVLALTGWCGIINAAELQLKVNDAQGQPVKNIVAALIPDNKPVFSTPAVAIIDQHNKMFMPGVMAIRTNTLMRFPNSDDIRHHVYSFSPAKKFELRLYHGTTAEPVLFDKPGTVVLGCNIHDSMVAYIYVVDTEFYAVGNEQGSLHIQAPAGKYHLQVFHPQLTTPIPELAIALNEKVPVQQQITLDKLTSGSSEKPGDEFSGLF